MDFRIITGLLILIIGIFLIGIAGFFRFKKKQTSLLYISTMVGVVSIVIGSLIIFAQLYY